VSTKTTGIVCLYFGNGEDCWNCGGWLKASGGPFEGHSRYCSEDCFAEAAERARRQAEYAATEWCPECGYDRHEHAPHCASQDHPLCPGGCGCRLGTDDADRRECGCDGGCCGD
jgi:hypothetical protein